MMLHVVYITKLCRNDMMCQSVNEVCDTTYSNCQWCNSTTSSDDDIGFCDLGKYQYNYDFHCQHKSLILCFIYTLRWLLVMKNQFC